MVEIPFLQLPSWSQRELQEGANNQNYFDLILSSFTPDQPLEKPRGVDVAPTHEDPKSCRKKKEKNSNFIGEKKKEENSSFME